MAASVRVGYISRVRLNPYVRLLARGVHMAAPHLEIHHSHFLSTPWLLREGRHLDVLHIHWGEYLYLAPRAWERRKAFVSVILALLLARAFGVRTVYTVHNLNHHEGRSPVLNRLFNAFLFRWVDAVHVHDPTVAATVQQRFGRRSGIYVIPHGPYIGAYPDTVTRASARRVLRERGIPVDPQRFLFLFLGQVRRYKGLEGLIAAFKQLNAADVQLLIVGRAEDPEYAEEVRRLARTDERIITHLTFVADEDLQYFFRAANVCVLPYRHITTSGAALLAFSFGCPIIAPAMGPFLELAAEGRGLLYMPGDVRGLTEALASAREGALREGGVRARTYAERLDWQRLGEAHVRVYERVLCRPLRVNASSDLPPVLCVGREGWEGPWRNRHHLMARIARHTPVVYVEPRPYVRGVARRPHKHTWRLRRWSPLPTAPDLWVVTLPAWTARAGRSPLRQVTDYLAQRVLRRACRYVWQCPAPRHEQRPILWLTGPEQADFIDLVRPAAVVYQVVDDYTAYEAEVALPAHIAWIRRQHTALLRRADAVICTHPVLAEEARRWNRNVHLVPNGVDWEWVQRAMAYPALPADLEAIPRPRVGYVGVINDKVDLTLLRAVVETFPEVHVAVIGPDYLRHRVAERAVLDHPRIHVLGFRPPQDTLLYMRGLDVALMPYRLNRWTAHIDPLKVYEYLALGLPVVSTPIPAVQRLEGLVYVGRDQAFIAAVGQALEEQAPEVRERRQAFARRNTWDVRAEQVLQVLRELRA